MSASFNIQWSDLNFSVEKTEFLIGRCKKQIESTNILKNGIKQLFIY